MEGLGESIKTLLSRIQPRFYLPIALASLGLLLVGYSLIQLFLPHGSRENFRLDEFSQASSSAKLASADITVDVEGAVVSPGVYTIKNTARLQDALVAAGGLAARADRGWVAKHLNLAQKITDGAKVYIPATGETVEAASTADSTVSSADGLININTASLDSLDSLPGIGQVTAQKIVNARPYTDVQDLVNRHIISAKVFEKIKASITVF